MLAPSSFESEVNRGSHRAAPLSDPRLTHEQSTMVRGLLWNVWNNQQFDRHPE